MISKITTPYFKPFASEEFTLGPLSLLAGPNNSGKTTLLQAAMVWNLAMQTWWEKKGPESGSRAKERHRPRCSVTNELRPAPIFPLSLR